MDRASSSSRSTLSDHDGDSCESLPSSVGTSLPASSPCSPSILLNPLTGPKASPKARPTLFGSGVFVTHHPSAPPAHWIAENPDHPAAKAASSSPPWGDANLPGSRSSSANPPTTRDGDDAAESRCLKFAPLPPGRRAYRSNSLSIGVAARARMISGQGAGAPYSQQRAQFAGPQQWYQTGGIHPPDVYTYKDVQKGITKLWGRVRKRSSASASSTEADAMERDSKDKSKVEHIEEALEGDSGDEDGHDGDDDDDEVEEVRGRALGLDLHDSDDSSATSDQPRTPPEHGDVPTPPALAKEKGKGKGKEVMRATSTAYAL